ncbi:MAG: PAS domain-containing protein [Pleurocapsa minor HA4230-MV1]|jgi:PAS domain S-box-containing protein|nr:PAS domain-containing protein [Pleurocapsa minor HA4230-MV1]
MKTLQSDYNILIVNDSLLERTTLRCYLQQETNFAYTVWEAESTEEAWQLCDSQLPDGIVLDYLLRDRDGLEFLVELKTSIGENCPPVIMVNDRGYEAIAIQAFKAGVEDYLIKQEITSESLRCITRAAIENFRLRQKLRQSEERFRTSIENMLDCFGIYTAIRDRDTGAIIDFKIEYLNAPALESNRMTVDDIGKPLCELLPAHRECGLFAEYCHVVETGKPLVKDCLIYADRFGEQDLTRAYSVQVRKLNDGFVASWRDITEEKQREILLQQSEERYREIIDQQTELICRFSPDLTLTFVNQAYSRYFDSTPEQLIGQNFLNLIPESDRSSVQQQITNLGRATPENAVLSHEHPVLKPNGEIGIQQWMNRAIFAQNGQLIEFQAVGRDISDRALAESALRQSEAFNRQILETIPDCIKVLDLEGKILYLNSFGQDLLGLHDTNYLNVRLVELWQKGDRTQLEQAIDLALSGEISKFEGYCPLKNGTPKWWEVVLTPRFDDNGQVEQLLSVSRDISDRKQMEASSQQQLAQIEAIYATAPIGLCFLDRERRFIQLNERLAEINGLPVSEHLGKTIREIVPELADIQESIFEQVFQTGLPILDVEVRGTTPAQPQVERHWLASYYPLKTADEQVLGINITVLEITERKQAEQERERLLTEAQTARTLAEAANRSKDEFVAVVAHELRSPINSVAGWAQLLRMRKFDPANVDRALEAIERGTQTQVQLIEDLLDISRMASGKLHLTLAPVNLAMIVGGAISLMRPMAEAKQIHLDSRLTALAQVSGDLNRLQQIVVNLLTNALKFTPEEGRVTITLKQVAQQAQIQVRDTGKGISPEILPSIFERFQQGQKNSGSKDGLGLGLAIVKNLVEMHDGTITADSPGIGQGATFTVYLPLLESAAANIEEVAIAPESVSLAGISILAVDDEPDSLELLKFILEEAGAEVQTAPSGSTALEILSQFNPSLIVSDIAMPDINGYQLLQKIRTRYPERQIPAIALTAYASSSDRDYALRIGFEKYFSKPIEPEVLMRTIVSLIKDQKT